MARYTVLEEQDIDEIGRYYDLSIDAFEPLVGGAGNSSYFVTAENKSYVLTVFDDKSLAQVAQLASLLGHLAANVFSTTRIVSPQDNKDPVMLFEDKPVLVKEYIAGEVYPQLDESMLGQAGSAMAALHQVAALDFLPQEHPYGKQVFPLVFDANIDPEYEAWLAERCVYLDENLPAKLPKRLIHGDLFYDNILFESGELKALIDFEEACHYFRAFDIGMGIVGMCVENGKIKLNKAKAFVRGYQGVEELQAAEKDSLQLFVEYAAIATSYWRFWKYNIHEPMLDKAQLHREMVVIADQVRAIPRGDFVAALFV